ncbi:MAG: outer membrane beta-barrel protein [Chitinophagaceae bacterium]
MKKILLILVVVLSCLAIQAQYAVGNPSNGGGRQAAAAIGHVYGKIVDNAGKAVSDASVILLQSRMDTVSKKMKDILLKGTATKNNGEFSLEELPVTGSLKLKISAVGFSPIEQTISFMPSSAGATAPKAPGAPGAARMPNFEKDLGNIKMAPDATQLQTVTVSATKPLMRLDIDKKVFNVEKNIVSAGGTALDVMKNVPSVNVDIDGNVQLRNSAPQIFVDGRPTTLSLDQIPADAIESVEVITNPSAKYDASGGGAGILNIVLKKNRKTGYNGNVRVGVDKRGAVNGGGDLSVRQDKVNISASIMGNQNKGRTSGTTDRLNLQDIPQTSIFQNNNNRTVGGFLFGKLGLDYFITNRTTLSVSAIRVHGEFNPKEVIGINTDSLFNTGKLSQFSQRTSTGTREFNGQGLVFGMKHLFPKDGEELTADANYFTGRNTNNSLYTTNYFANNSSTITGNELQKVLGDGNDKNITLQTDYVKPLSAKTKLEAGLRASIRERVNNNNNFIYDDVSGEYNIIPSATGNYKSSDNVYAAYASISSSIRDFGYKLGLRAESSNYTGELLNTKEKFSNSYPVSLFPSVFLSQKLTSNQELQVSFTRRINRPNFFQLIPFTDYTDKLNITKGNAGLVPEFTQSVEMSYLKTFKGNNSLLGSLYYKNTTDLITRYQTKELNPITGTEDLINTYINANSSYSAGAEITSQNYLTKWMDISTNVNIYNSKINTDNISGSSQDALWSWFGKFNSNFKLPSKFTIQLTATYQSKTNLPVNNNTGGMGGGPGMMQSQSASQGYIRAFWGTDIAIKRTFLKNDAASISLSVNDIFKTRSTSQYSESEYFIQNYTRLRDPQMIRLNLSYRFGKIDAMLFKRKSNSSINATEGMQ